jgi:curved DNA-binding protein CbpA
MLFSKTVRFALTCIIDHMSDFRTHYDNLKVARNAPDSVIKAAYKTLIQQYHPDKIDGSKEEALRITKLINESYEVLNDPVKRGEHNRWIDAQEAKAKHQSEKEQFRKTDEATEQKFDNGFDYQKSYTEEDLYEIAANELSSGMAMPGIMAKAFAETNGDDKRSAARYMQLRFMALKELLLSKEIEVEQLYIAELINLGCKVSSNDFKLWKSKKWKITTKQNEVFVLTNLAEFKSVIEHCKERNYQEQVQHKERKYQEQVQH